MPLAQEAIQAYLRNDEGANVSERQARLVSSRFRYFQNTIEQYFQLPSDPKGYLSLASSRDVTPIAGSKQAALPFIISLIPPDVYPSDRTVLATIPTPSTATFDLVRIKSASNLPSVSVDQNTVVATSAVQVPVEPQFTVPSYLRSRRKDFERDALAAQTILDQQTQTQVEGRPEENDAFLAASQAIQDAKSGANDLRYLRQQAEQMRDLPSLVLLVNPNNLTRSYNHIISAGDRARSGYVVEHWGEQLPTLSISGNSGGFYILNRKGGGGLTASREGSAAYQQFMNLFQIYRNNGYLRNEDKTIGLVGAVEIFYDGKIYTGSFGAFTYTEDEAKPFSVDYTMEFTVRYEQDVRIAY